MYHLNVMFFATKKFNNITCGLSTSVSNLLTFFFAICNNWPVQVIGHVGKRPEIMVHAWIGCIQGF